jgi:predicted extracellular nuclease
MFGSNLFEYILHHTIIAAEWTGTNWYTNYLHDSRKVRFLHHQKLMHGSRTRFKKHPFEIMKHTNLPIIFIDFLSFNYSSGLTSTMLGQSVIDVRGIVTAVASNLFYMQEATGDGNPNTSDAIVVLTSTTPTVQIGDLVSVFGTVAEFTPGGASTRNLSTTQISSTLVNIISSGNLLPAPIVLGPGGRLLPTESMQAGVTFFESLEGMLVTIPRVQVVDATNIKGEIFAIIGQDMDFETYNTGRSSRGTINISPGDFNPEKIQIDFDPIISDGLFFIIPVVNVGSILSDITGVVAYDDGNFEIVPTQRFTVTKRVTPPETIIGQTLTQYTLSIGTFNVMDLDQNDDDGDYDVEDGRFGSVAVAIAINMYAPDIIALQEIQDDSGAVDDGTISASNTLLKLIAEINAVNPYLSYKYIDNTFIGNNKNGQEPGGNARTAFLYNPSRITFTGETNSTTSPSDQQNNPNHPFYNSHLPLAAKFKFNGRPIEIINNHWSSKVNSAPIMGTVQPFETKQEDTIVNGGLAKRKSQSNVIRNYVAGKSNTIVLGDFNEFEFVTPLTSLDFYMPLLTTTIPPNERYSYIFQGNSQALDHIFVSQNLESISTAEYVHMNCEYASTPNRASDHDPMVARINFPVPNF